LKRIFIYFGIIIIFSAVSFAFFTRESVKQINLVREVQEVFSVPETVSVLSFGDIMLDRGVRTIMEKRGRDPFEYIKKDIDEIRKFDVVIANLEGPIVEMNRKDCQQKAYNFQFASTTPDRLKSIGITMVTIANNHSYDCYKVGFESTKKYLQSAGIEYIGDTPVEKSFVIKDIHGKKVAFVGIDQTMSSSKLPLFYELVKKLKSENDYVLVHVHWGTEYELKETAVQKAIAYTLIDNGVDVVFGHHPHVPEPVEVYKGKVVFYSLGNFVFDQYFSQEVQTGLALKLKSSEDKNEIELIPVSSLESKAQPQIMKREEREVFLQNLAKRSSLEINETILSGKIEF
jgi:poly-gamma-glutamate synthesis protein (capsule biosynthesis protein)